MMKKPRKHEGLAWEASTLSNDFIDVNKMALDDRYGKVGAPLSKRRNGIGFTDGKTAGLFGIGSDTHYHPFSKPVQEHWGKFPGGPTKGSQGYEHSHLGIGGIGHRVPMRESGANYTDEEIDTWVRNTRFLTQYDISSYVDTELDPLRYMDREIRYEASKENHINRNYATESDYQDRSWAQEYADGRDSKTRQNGQDTVAIMGGLLFVVGILGFYVHSKTHHAR